MFFNLSICGRAARFNGPSVLTWVSSWPESPEAWVTFTGDRAIRVRSPLSQMAYVVVCQWGGGGCARSVKSSVLIRLNLGEWQHQFNESWPGPFILHSR